MTTTFCRNDIIDTIIDLQQRRFDHDFILDHEHIRCLQYNERIVPDDFEILETHLCGNGSHVKENYILYGIELKTYNIKGILMSNRSSFNYSVSLKLWRKFDNEIGKSFNRL